MKYCKIPLKSIIKYNKTRKSKKHVLYGKNESFINKSPSQKNMCFTRKTLENEKNPLKAFSRKVTGFGTSPKIGPLAGSTKDSFWQKSTLFGRSQKWTYFQILIIMGNA